MNVYIYDKTFDGLLTAVLDAYNRKKINKNNLTQYNKYT